jgi:hypothetical protein
MFEQSDDRQPATTAVPPNSGLANLINIAPNPTPEPDDIDFGIDPGDPAHVFDATPAIPALPASLQRTDLTLLDAARALTQTFKVIPTNTAAGKAKHPGSVVGNGWPDKATRDPAVYTPWFSDTLTTKMITPDEFYRHVPFENRGIAIMLGPDYVAIDIDTPDNVPTELWPLLEACNNYQSTSALDPRRGHYVFAKPDGYRFNNSAIKGSHGKGSPGETRHGNAIIAAAPTEHPKKAVKRRYQWIRTGNIQTMPKALAEWCKSRSQTAGFNGKDITVTTAGLDGLEEFANTALEASHPQILAEQIDHLHHLAYYGTTGAIHPAAINIAVNTLGFAAHGLISGDAAIDALVDEFIAIRGDQSRDGSHSDEDTARAEMLDICGWALGRVQANAEADPDGYAWHVASCASAWFGIPITVAKPDDYTEPTTPEPSVGPATAKLRGIGTNDNELAHLFMERNEDLHALRLGDGTKAKDNQWLLWDEQENRWKRRHTPDLYELFQRSVAELFRQSANEYATAAEADDLEPAAAKALQKRATDMRKTGHRLGNTGPQNAALAQAHPLRQTTLSTFDPIIDVPQYPAANGKLVFTNPDGTLRDASAILERYERNDRILAIGGTAYDPTAQSEVLDSYLDIFHPDPTERRRLQKAMGYTLLDGNPDKKVILAAGERDSGKTTLIEAMMGMHGPLGGTFSLAMFTDAEKADPCNSLLYQALPKRFLGTTEASSAQVLHAELVKKLTGNDTIAARELYSNDIRQRVPGFTLMLGTNKVPRIPKLDAATVNRFLVFDFAVSHRDPTATALKKDPQALAALLRWCVEGLMLYLAEGFTTEELGRNRERLTSTATVEGYVLSLHLIRDPAASTPLPALWEALAAFTKQHPYGYSLDGSKPRDLPTTLGWQKGGYLKSNGYDTKKLPEDATGKRYRGVVGYRLATPDEVKKAENQPVDNHDQDDEHDDNED